MWVRIPPFLQKNKLCGKRKHSTNNIFMKKYKYFWGGIYSNWQKSPFTIEIDGENITFNCAEQYMMYYKALISNDNESLLAVMQEKNPREQKAIGRAIENFNSKEWDKSKYDLMLIGLMEKFKQNPKLKEELLAEDCDLFVEASPFDRVWGIGYSEQQNPEDFIENWGENLLGKLITEVRDNLKN